METVMERGAQVPAINRMTNDEALMLQFQQGSREAFDELFTRYRAPLYGFFRRRLANDARAEDLTQETFLAVIRATARYEPRALVRTYLYGIALNLLASERRKQARNPLPLDEGPEPAVDDASEEVFWVRQAIGRLEEREREVLMLREYEQLSYDEISTLLRIPVNTVRSRLFRSRMALKNYLQPEKDCSAGSEKASQASRPIDSKRSKGTSEDEA
ncbi:MAG TPA: RNA polymerase sigma factor [Candidatus Saccharimonadales bacterium]|nr:RNA polymerase sigma factor [Candidatus Saccharimonadales bacterium]